MWVVEGLPDTWSDADQHVDRRVDEGGPRRLSRTAAYLLPTSLLFPSLLPALAEFRASASDAGRVLAAGSSSIYMVL